MHGFLKGLGLALLVQLASPAAAGDAGAMLAGPTLLGQGQTVVPVRVNCTQSAESGARAELVIEGLASDAPPGVMYEVSLQGAQGRRAPIGLISFYNRTAPGYGVAPEDDSRRVFDATEALRSLGGQATALVFVPSSGVAGAGIRVAANVQARVRFSSAWLR